MASESPRGKGALTEESTKTNDQDDSTLSPQRPISSATFPFGGAPALKPNCKERRQRPFSSVPYVMLHATWCRVYGDGLRAGTPPRPNGGAA
jgi:hypothetical protein